MRTFNSIRNITIAMLGQVIGVCISFISRIVFINTVGIDYLGVSGLLTNVLSILSLAELGIGTAIIFCLYKPLAYNDKDKIRALMNLYSKAYTYIGGGVAIIGISILPFLKYIIKDNIDITNLNLIYMLFLINSVVTYFFAYKRSLLIADQKNYITTIYRYSFYTALNIIQIIILLITKSYYIFLTAQILFTLLENISISRKVDKLYPFLKDTNAVYIDKSDKISIIKNVKALICHQLGGTIVGGTDNIIISSFLGVYWVGLYSNYLFIITSVNVIISQIFNAITASVGNLNTSSDKKKSYEVYNLIYFFNFLIISIATIVLINVINPFISLWIGEEFILNIYTVGILIINFYFIGMRKVTLIFKETFGLFWQDRYKPLLEGGINLIISIVLVKSYGIIGVFIGTMIGTLLTCFWIEPYILFKYGFERNIKEYFKKYTIYGMITIINSIISIYICSFVSVNTIVDIIIRVMISTTVTILVSFIILFKSEEVKYSIAIIKQIIGSSLKKISSFKK